MNKVIKLALCSALLLGAVAFGYAESKTYKYKCPKCNRVSEYSMPKPGVKCPSGDGWLMKPAN